MSIRRFITQNLYNIPGWRTNRHIVVIESDDWGSIRMPSKRVYNILIESGIRVDQCYYCSNDSIASEKDLSLLFDVLHSVKDINGNPAVITANAVVANPDFSKIKASGFNEYHYKKITDDIPHIKGCENSLKIWKQGHEDGCFRIQSHGREHLNVARWMRCLKGDYPETKRAFDLGVFGISTNITHKSRKSFLPAMDFETNEEEHQINEIVLDGLRIFQSLFGFKSKSFIAPNYCWGKSLETVLHEGGVRYLQGQQIAIYKEIGNIHKRRLRKIGNKNEFGLIDLSRNAFFETSSNINFDWVNHCMAEICTAFRWHKPAIICSHRVNFIGSINEQNRDNGLRSLAELLKQIKHRWADVEFLSSDQLGDVIINDEHGRN